MSNNLFTQEMKLRDRYGRYATPERSYADRIKVENEKLRCTISKLRQSLDVERRARYALAKVNTTLQHKLENLKQKYNNENYIQEANR